jgi:hypothetical protein
VSESKDIAGRLEVLAGQVAELERNVNAEVDELKDAVLDLLGQLDEVKATLAPPSPPKKPRAWVNGASPADWRELTAWVDWLTETYDFPQATALLPCWPAHLGVAEELAALWQAWKAAAVATHQDSMATWHDRLHTTLPRLREDSQMRTCVDAHQRPRTASPTDLELLATALVDAAERAEQARAETPDPSPDPSVEPGHDTDSDPT